jgi:hypothetical protein
VHCGPGEACREAACVDVMTLKRRKSLPHDSHVAFAKVELNGRGTNRRIRVYLGDRM